MLARKVVLVPAHIVVPGFVLMLIVLLVKPSGLFGRTQVHKV